MLLLPLLACPVGEEVSVNIFKELLSRSTADGSRTNALNHIQWMIAAFLVVFMIAATSGLATAVQIFIGSITVLLVIAYLVTHFYFAVKNPDALRSEKFTIQKMAIERAIIGDSKSGIREVLKGQVEDSFLLGSGEEESKP